MSRRRRRGPRQQGSGERAAWARLSGVTARSGGRRAWRRGRREISVVRRRLAAYRADEPFDPQSSLKRILMLPDAQHLPSGCSEPLVGVGISALGPAYLFSPVLGVRLSDVAVPGASVPEAAVEEDRHLWAAKHQVCRSPQLWQRAGCDTVPQPECVDSAPQCHLWSGVTATVRSHDRSDSVARCPGFFGATHGRTVANCTSAAAEGAAGASFRQTPRVRHGRLWRASLAKCSGKMLT